MEHYLSSSCSRGGDSSCIRHVLQSGGAIHPTVRLGDVGDNPVDVDSTQRLPPQDGPQLSWRLPSVGAWGVGVPTDRTGVERGWPVYDGGVRPQATSYTGPVHFG